MNIRIETIAALKAIKEYGEPMTNDELAEALNIPLNNVNKRSKRMSREELITRTIGERAFKSGRNKVLFCEITQKGIEAIFEYESKQAKRPSVFQTARSKLLAEINHEKKINFEINRKHYIRTKTKIVLDKDISLIAMPNRYDFRNTFLDFKTIEMIAPRG